MLDTRKEEKKLNEIRNIFTRVSKVTSLHIPIFIQTNVDRMH